MSGATLNGVPASLEEDGEISRALVVGTGMSARAAARLLDHLGVEVLVTDDAADTTALAELGALGHQTLTPGQALEAVERSIDVVVPSPGVPEHAPVVVRALGKDVAVWSEPELALRAFRRAVIGITGTNGKTSTTDLVTRMLRADGRSALSCGNIGIPLADAVLDTDVDTVLVAELSSFQLRFVDRARIATAALLNLAPDHLDWHGDLTAYGDAKARIWRAQHPQDWSVANADDRAAARLRDRHAVGAAVDFSALRPVEHGVGRSGDELVWFGRDRSVPLLEVGELATPSGYHVANVAAACTLALLHGARPAALVPAARTFAPGEHRGVVVAEHGGVRWVNDSKATNPHAAAAALDAAGPAVWIAGGLAKGVDLAPLSEHLSRVRHAVLIGEAADALARVCAHAQVPAEQAADLHDAVRRAHSVARAGEVVLLAPACASFDQFRDYRERGRRFAEAVRSVLAEVHAGAGEGRA